MKSLETQLLERNICKPEEIEQAGNIQREFGGSIADILINLGVASEKEILKLLSDIYGIELLEERGYDDFEKIAVGEIPDKFFAGNNIFPIAMNDRILEVALHDPRNVEDVETLAMLSDRNVQRVLATSEEIEKLRQLYASEEGLAYDAEHIEDEADRLKELASEAPIIKLANNIFTKAAGARASDIHFEAFLHGLRVRFRIDGSLNTEEVIPVQLKSALVARLKLISKMNISENRLPQDGRFAIKVSGEELDVRASSVPTAFGESFVLRLLRKESMGFDLQEMGFGPHHVNAFKGVLGAPNGIFLTTGPTGSGKTSTLYAALNHLSDEETKIITVEDPVEYQLDGINQIQVKSAIDYTFANALRSILRQDPDIIMIGEIRDKETAEIAIQSALTGHLVLSTLHTNSALGAIARLLDMGIEFYLLKSTIVGLMAQRLAKKLCEHCKRPLALDEATRKLYGLDEIIERFMSTDTVAPCQKTGCEKCNHTGYLGRVPVIEIVPFSEELARRFEASKNFNDLEAIGVMSMYEDGLVKFLKGHTTLDEINKLEYETDV